MSIADVVLSRPSVLVRAADHRVAEHHGRGFHPGAMLALHRHIAGEIGRAGLQDLDAVIRDCGFVFLLVLEDFSALALRLPLVPGRRRPADGSNTR